MPPADKSVYSISTQTDDYGCPNGCSSIYFHVPNTFTHFIEHNSENLPRQVQQTSDTHVQLHENSLNIDQSAENSSDLEEEQDQNESSMKAISSIMRVLEELDGNSGKCTLENDATAMVGMDGTGSDANDNGQTTAFYEDTTLHDCNRCDKQFLSRALLISHLRSHAGERMFECNYCEKSFVRKYDLKKHIRIHTGFKPYQCSHCAKKFTESGNLKKHLKIHENGTDQNLVGNKSNSNKDTETQMLNDLVNVENESEHCDNIIEIRENVEKPFECLYCQKKFAKKGVLKTHLQRHKGVKPFGCKQCGKTFVFKHDIIRHLRVHSGEKPFECPHCDKTFSDKSNLNKHQNNSACMKGSTRKQAGCSNENVILIARSTDSSSKEYTCSQCDKSFTSRYNLVKHFRVHSEENPFECKQCKMRFSETGNLNKHMRQYCKGRLQDKLPDENQCHGTVPGTQDDQTMQTSDSEMQNYVGEHSGMKYLECSFCDQQFLGKDDLSEHLKVAHVMESFHHRRDTEMNIIAQSDFEDETGHGLKKVTPKKLYQCSYCEKKFTSRNDLTKHIRVHTGEKPFQCTACMKRFSEKGNLNKHLKTHNKEKDKTGEENNGLNELRMTVIQAVIEPLEHTVQNNMEGPTNTQNLSMKFFKCSHCEKKFTSRSDCKKHLRVHSGEKPYQCTVCMKRFSEKGNLNKHLKTHDKEKERNAPKENDDLSNNMTVEAACDKPSEHSANFGIDNASETCVEEQMHNIHVHVKNPSKKIFQCSHCEKKFSYRYDFKKHLQIHTGEKPFECSFCSKKFSEKGNLNKHLKTHERDKEKPLKKKTLDSLEDEQDCHSVLMQQSGRKCYECTDCEKKFISKYDFTKHYRIHTGEKPYECPYCKKGFAESGNLNKHIQTHTERTRTRTLNCEYCPRKFSKKLALRKHLETHTRKEELMAQNEADKQEIKLQEEHEHQEEEPEENFVCRYIEGDDEEMVVVQLEGVSHHIDQLQQAEQQNMAHQEQLSSLRSDDESYEVQRTHRNDGEVDVVILNLKKGDFNKLQE